MLHRKINDSDYCNRMKTGCFNIILLHSYTNKQSRTFCEHANIQI